MDELRFSKRCQQPLGLSHRPFHPLSLPCFLDARHLVLDRRMVESGEMGGGLSLTIGVRDRICVPFGWQGCVGKQARPQGKILFEFPSHTHTHLRAPDDGGVFCVKQRLEGYLRRLSQRIWAVNQHPLGYIVSEA